MRNLAGFLLLASLIIGISLSIVSIVLMVITLGAGFIALVLSIGGLMLVVETALAMGTVTFIVAIVMCLFGLLSLRYEAVQMFFQTIGRAYKLIVDMLPEFLTLLDTTAASLHSMAHYLDKNQEYSATWYLRETGEHLSSLGDEVKVPVLNFTRAPLWQVTGDNDQQTGEGFLPRPNLPDPPFPPIPDVTVFTDFSVDLETIQPVHDVIGNSVTQLNNVVNKLHDVSEILCTTKDTLETLAELLRPLVPQEN